MIIFVDHVHHRDPQAIRTRPGRRPLVRPLDGEGLLPQCARPPRTLHCGDPAAQRNGRAAHGPHAQQHHPGRAGAPRPHAGQERLLGAGYGPCQHRHRSEGGAAARRAGDQEKRHRPRGVPEARLRVEGEVRRRDPRATEEARRQLRLGAHALHHGARPQRCRHRRVHRPAQEGPGVPWPTHGELGPPGPHRRKRRGGDLQGGELQALLPPLPGGRQRR